MTKQLNLSFTIEVPVDTGDARELDALHEIIPDLEDYLGQSVNRELAEETATVEYSEGYGGNRTVVGSFGKWTDG